MKKTVIMACTILAFSITACNSSNKENTTVPETTTVAATTLAETTTAAKIEANTENVFFDNSIDQFISLINESMSSSTPKIENLNTDVVNGLTVHGGNIGNIGITIVGNEDGSKTQAIYIYSSLLQADTDIASRYINNILLTVDKQMNQELANLIFSELHMDSFINNQIFNTQQNGINYLFTATDTGMNFAASANDVDIQDLANKIAPKTASLSTDELASKFEQLKNDMPYEEAVTIMGYEGKNISSTEVSGVKIETYQWVADDGISNITVITNNGIITSKNQANLNSEKAELTLDIYNAIETGMSYEEVEKIIGIPGQVLTDTNLTGVQSTMYMWNSSTDFANITIMFQDNIVATKSQHGLE